MNAPKQSGWVYWVIPAALTFYFFAGLATKRTGEVFPIFHWALYAVAPETKTDYELYILEQDGRQFAPPVLLQNTEEYGEWLAASYNVYNSLGIIDSFASAYRAGRTERSARLEKGLEQNFIPGEIVRYEIRQVEYDARERYRTGKIMDSTTIGVFSKEKNVSGH